MAHTELDMIAASMTDAIHRAYALGRTDALRRIGEMVQSDDHAAKTVAVPASAETIQAPAPEPMLELPAPDYHYDRSETVEAEPTDAKPAWWRRPLSK